MLIKIREMVSFELSKEIKKDVFHTVTSMGLRKNYESSWGSKPQTFRFHTLMLYHWATETPQWVRSIILGPTHDKTKKHLSLKSYVVCWISWIHMHIEGKNKLANPPHNFLSFSSSYNMALFVLNMICKWQNDQKLRQEKTHVSQNNGPGVFWSKLSSTL